MKNKTIIYTLLFIVTASVSYPYIKDINNTKGETIEFACVMDISKTPNRNNLPSVEALYEYISKVSEIPNNEKEYYPKGIVVYFSTIGAQKRPVVTKIQLDGGSHPMLDNHHKRSKAVAAFKIKLRQKIKALLNTAANDNYTRIAESLGYLTAVMKDNSFSNTHKIIVLTDGIADDPENKYDLDTLGKNGDANNHFETIANNIASDTELNDLTSFDINIIATGTIKPQRNAEIALDFWIYFFKSQDSIIRIRSSLLNL